VDFHFSYDWFDRISISPDMSEHVETLESIGWDVSKFIQQ